jgi:hypothetical protein
MNRQMLHRLTFILAVGLLLLVVTYLDSVQAMVARPSVVEHVKAENTPQQLNCFPTGYPGEPHCKSVFLPLVSRSAQARSGPFDLVGELQAPNTTTVALSGTLAYVQGYYGDIGLITLDVSDPANPMQLGQSSRSVGTFVQIGGTNLYGGTFEPEGREPGISGELISIDVSDPSNPAQDYVRTTTPGGVTGLHVVDSIAYVTSTPIDLISLYYLTVYNLGDPSSPRPIGQYQFPSSQIVRVTSVYVENGFAYTAMQAYCCSTSVILHHQSTWEHIEVMARDQSPMSRSKMA